MQDHDSFPHKHFKTKWKPHKQDREKTKHRNLEENLSLESRNNLSQTEYLECKQSGTDIVAGCSNYLDKIGTTSFICEQSPNVHKNTEKSQNNASRRVLYKSQSLKTLTSGHASESVNSEASLQREGKMCKSSPEKECCHSLCKESADRFDSARSLHHDEDVHVNASVFCSPSDFATNSSQTSSTCLPVPQDSHRFSNQFSRSDSSEIVNQISLDSNSDFLDNFLNHDIPLLGSVNTDNCTVSSTPKAAADCHKSHLSDTISHDVPQDTSSGYSSITSSHNSDCDNNQPCSCSNFSQSSIFITPSHGSKHPSQEIVKVITSSEKSGGEEETQKPGHIHNKITSTPCATVIIPELRKCCHLLQSGKWDRKESCSYGKKVIECRCDAIQGVQRCHSGNSNYCSSLPDAIPQGHFKRKDLRNTSLQLRWRSRKVINYKWKWSSHATVQQHEIYHNAERQCAKSGEMVDVTQSDYHPQKLAMPDFKECKQNCIKDTCPAYGERKTTMGITIDKFYGQMKSSQSCQGNLVKRINSCSRQEKPFCAFSHGKQDSSLLHQAKHSVHGETSSTKGIDHSLVSGIRHSADQKGDGCLTQCFQFLNKNKHFHSELCSKNRKGTLYECFKCARKFASKYNLHEHQYFCVQ